MGKSKQYNFERKDRLQKDIDNMIYYRKFKHMQITAKQRLWKQSCEVKYKNCWKQ